MASGKLTLPEPPRRWIEQQRRTWELDRLPIQPEPLYRSTELPAHHRAVRSDLGVTGDRGRPDGRDTGPGLRGLPGGRALVGVAAAGSRWWHGVMSASRNHSLRSVNLPSGYVFQDRGPGFNESPKFGSMRAYGPGLRGGTL